MTSSPPTPEPVWPRLRAALVARPSAGQLVVGILCGLLAFALVTQVHATAAGGTLASARPADLLGILADLNDRADRLRAEIADLQASERRLASGSNRDAAALREARARADTLGVLTGTLPASGPGIVLTVEDPQRRLPAAVVLDAVEELRDAGAEALQLSGVRVVADTAFVDARGGGIAVAGRTVQPPYRLLAIGDPPTLAAALGIPGGVLDAVARVPGAHAVIVRSPHLTITALQPLNTPRYARPAQP